MSIDISRGLKMKLEAPRLYEWRSGLGDPSFTCSCELVLSNRDYEVYKSVHPLINPEEHSFITIECIKILTLHDYMFCSSLIANNHEHSFIFLGDYTT